MAGWDDMLAGISSEWMRFRRWEWWVELTDGWECDRNDWIDQIEIIDR